MDNNKPLLDRDEVRLWDRWWLPAGVGGTALILAFATARDGVRPEPWQIGLVSFGILVGLIDGLGSWKVISYGTVQGPDEREDEAMARLFVWERARWRYGLGIVVSVVVTLLLPTMQSSDEASLAVILGPWFVYFGLWAYDAFRSLREAKRLFPPEAATTR